jgi:hypothetical protein
MIIIPEVSSPFHAFEIALATMDHVSVAVGAAALILVYAVYRRYTSISLADVPGPEPASFIMGMSVPFCWVFHC